MQTSVSVSQEEEKPLPRRRKRLPISFILGGLAILGAVIYLVYANTQANAVYYLTVSELKNCSICTTQSVRVAGVVQDKSVVRNDQQQQISFVISDGGHSLPELKRYLPNAPQSFKLRHQGRRGEVYPRPVVRLYRVFLRHRHHLTHTCFRVCRLHDGHSNIGCDTQHSPACSQRQTWCSGRCFFSATGLSRIDCFVPHS